MDKKYILGIDCGTSLAKIMIVDRDANQVGFESADLIILKPREGYAEHDPIAVWDSIYSLILKTFSNNGIVPKQIAAIGITNQRETTVVWNNKTGIPYCDAVVWFDKRAESLAVKYSEILGIETVERVGMYTIPHTSAMLLAWLLQNDPKIKEGVEKGEACFGTMNSWLLWKLTGGETHVSDFSNMSVTQLQNAKDLEYDEEVLNYLNIPREILPEITGTGEIFGLTTEKLFSGEKIPVAGMLGDQMAAALGQGCVKKGMVKSTYGTGCFIVMNTGEQYIPPTSGLFSPVLWGDKNNPTYGLEGFLEIHGERTDKAVLEGIVYQTTNIIKTMEMVTDQNISVLRIDGGMAKNDYLCQFQADLLGIPVERPAISEATVLGAIYQTGLTIGFWSSLEE
ncbi:MAG: hypothetical protein KAS62_07335, partial [Candidatus Delongbacteria bacterium]|nr:hypothetical protein [Candidatus Delongbacteria bacterium]